MKIYSIHLFYCSENSSHPVLLFEACNYDDINRFNIIGRNTLYETCKFISRTVAQRINPSKSHTVYHEEYDYRCHALKLRGVCCTIISDLDYKPTRILFELANNLIKEIIGSSLMERLSGSRDITKIIKSSEFGNTFNKKLDKYLSEYQDPGTVDKIAAINKELEKAREILTQSIDQLCDRGETLNHLIDTSNDLSFQSKKFLDETNKLNKCCVIL